MASSSTIHLDIDDYTTVATTENPIMYFDKDGGGPNYHVCAAFVAIGHWLDRQKLLGLITPEGAAAVEKLIEDLR